MAAQNAFVDNTSYGKLRWWLLLGFALASLLEVLDTSIINPVLPTMAGNLGCTTEEIGWVSTAYMLANVVFLPMTAWFSRRFGLGRYIAASTMLFVVASVLCGFSHSLGQIVIWRLVQGAAGAPLISMTQAGIAEVFPKKEHNIAQGVWAMCIMVAPSVAPYLGGWIADNYSWPWIFFINVPFGIVATAIVLSLYKQRTERELGGADWLGISLLCVGLGAVQYVLEEGNSNDWFNSLFITRLAWLGIVATGLFVWWELSPRNKAPIVNLRVLRNIGLLGGFVLCFIVGAAMYSGLYVFPIFAQAVLGYTATKSGYFMLLPGIYLAVATVVSVVLIEKGVKARDITMAGIAVFIASMWFLGHSTPMSNESDTQVAMNWRAVGIAAMMLPIMTASIMTLRGAEVGEGTALLGLSRQLGGSIGVAIAATQLTVMTQFHRYHLMDRISSGAPAFQDRMNLIAGALYTRGMSPDAARQGAAKIVDFQVSIQAYTMAVNNVYILTGIMLVIGVPFLFMMKRGRSDGVAVGH